MIHTRHNVTISSQYVSLGKCETNSNEHKDKFIKGYKKDVPKFCNLGT